MLSWEGDVWPMGRRQQWHRLRRRQHPPSDDRLPLQPCDAIK